MPYSIAHKVAGAAFAPREALPTRQYCGDVSNIESLDMRPNMAENNTGSPKGSWVLLNWMLDGPERAARF